MKYYICVRINNSITFIIKTSGANEVRMASFNEAWNNRELISFTNKKDAIKRLNEYIKEYEKLFSDRKIIKHFINGDDDLKLFLAELKIEATA